MYIIQGIRNSGQSEKARGQFHEEKCFLVKRRWNVKGEKNKSIKLQKLRENLITL